MDAADGGVGRRIATLNVGAEDVISEEGYEVVVHVSKAHPYEAGEEILLNYGRPVKRVQASSVSCLARMREDVGISDEPGASMHAMHAWLAARSSERLRPCVVDRGGTSHRLLKACDTKLRFAAVDKSYECWTTSIASCHADCTVAPLHTTMRCADCGRQAAHDHVLLRVALALRLWLPCGRKSGGAQHILHPHRCAARQHHLPPRPAQWSLMGP